MGQPGRALQGRAPLVIVACVFLLALVAFGSRGSRSEAASNPSARAYLDHALALMRANAVYTPPLGWAGVTRTVHSWDGQAIGPSDEHGAISYAIGLLQIAGDRHAVFIDPNAAKGVGLGGPVKPAVPSRPPTVSLEDGRYGLIALLGIASAPQSEDARRYATRALSRISRLQAQHQPCGWIIDLRNNTGGDMAPMLLGLGPILGSGRLIGFARGNHVLSYDSYRNNTLITKFVSYTAPVKVADLAPAPPVAVLTGPNTISAGEATAIAFRGRPRTRSFGAATGGGPTSPQYYRLSDGAMIGFAVVFDADRLGTIYTKPIQPDVVTRRSPIPEAKRWLDSTAACSQPPSAG